MGSVGKSISHAWKKVTGGGSSSSSEKAASTTDSSVGGAASAEAEKAEVTDFDGALSKSKKAKKSGTELGSGQRTFGALSETLG